MQGLWTDLVLALRGLRKAPGFALAAIAVLGLGVGANTALFSVVYGVLLRPLPFPEPEQLVQLWHTPPAKSFPGIDTFSLSAANYLDWQKQNDVFERSAIYEYTDLHLGGVEPKVLDGAKVETTFFATHGVKPLLGRGLEVGDEQPGRSQVVVLSHKLWRSQFASDPAIIGRAVELSGQTYTVVGVMPHSFVLPDWATLWTPLVWTAEAAAVRGEHHYGALARLKPGVGVAQAQAQLSAIAARLATEYPADNAGWGARVVPLREQIVGEVREPLLVLFGAVAFVLLIACANVGNLMLAKTLDRRKEIAIRTALGASRGRILRQVLCEALLLGLAGGALGLLVASFGTSLIVSFLGEKLPRLAEISVDEWVLGFTLAISLVTGVAAGILPAWRLSSGDPNEAMKQGGARADVSSRGKRTRGALVVVEVALSLVLLVGAGLMLRTLWNLRRVDPGFDPRQVVTLTVAPTPTEYTHAEQEVTFLRDALARIRSLPGVLGAGLVDTLPLAGGGSMQPIAIEGHPAAAMADQPEVAVRVVSPGYMPAMRIPVLRGRDFADSDGPGAARALLVSRSMAERFWPGEDAVGKRLTLTFFPQHVRQIVGVVGDVKGNELSSTQPEPTLYLPAAQLLGDIPGEFEVRPFELVVRTSADAHGAVGSVMAAVHEVKAGTPLMNPTTLEEKVAQSILPHRFNLLLFGAFAALALLLAAVGIHSVLAYSVRQRRRELGIRMALGARPGEVLRMVLADGLRPTGLGLAVGLLAALALGRLVTALIYGVQAIDVLTLTAAGAVLVAVGLLASLLPALRATRVDPLETLRDE